MKIKIEEPKMKVVRFTAEDVIAASGNEQPIPMPSLAGSASYQDADGGKLSVANINGSQ